MEPDLSLHRIINHAYRRGRDRGLDMVSQQRMAVAAVRAVRPDLGWAEVEHMVERLDGIQDWIPPLPDGSASVVP